MKKQQKLDRVSDAIRKRFGPDSILMAGAYGSDLKVGWKHKAQQETGANKSK